MATYLSRPVFPRPINWAESVAESFSYDLNDQWIGQAMVADPLQSHTARGIEFSVLLTTEDEIADFDEWSDDLAGRLNGFWLPSPWDSAEIVSAYDNQSYYVRRQDGEQWYDDHPGIHVVFSKAGESDQYAKVDWVMDQRTGYEVVALTSPLSVRIDSTWSVRPLLYVRLATDTEEAEFVADHAQRRRIRVIELPTEYASLELGSTPVWLYRFWFDEAGAEWTYTSLNVAVTSQSTAFASHPIRHRSHQRSLLADRDSIDLESWHDDSSPLAMFLPFTSPKPLWIEVFRTTYAAPDVRTTVFCGKVGAVDFDGKRITARCSSLLDVLGRRVPAMSLQNRCNWFLFSDPCGVAVADWSATVTIKRLNGPYVDVTDPAGQASLPDPTPENLFQYGWLETGTGKNLEIRQIVRSSSKAGGNITLSLNAPLVHAALDQSAAIRTGCDGTTSMCKTRYSNFDNWGGHVLVPTNLSVQAMEVPNESVGSK